MWAVQTSEIFDEWFADRNPDGQVEVIATVELLKGLGAATWPTARRYAQRLSACEHERTSGKYGGSGAWIAFAFDPERNAILLIAGDKSGVGQRRFYKQLIAKADELYDAHLAKLQGKKRR